MTLLVSASRPGCNPRCHTTLNYRLCQGLEFSMYSGACQHFKHTAAVHNGLVWIGV